MLGLFALFGPPAFGIEVGVLSALYSLALVGYALWALRLTVVFHDDPTLGYLLTLFDVAMTLPLLIWGTTPWLAAPVVLLWVAGLSVSALQQRRRRVARTQQGDHLVDPATGLMSARRFPAAVEGEAQLAAVRGKCFSLITVRIHRFQEVATYYGPDAAERALVGIARRALRTAGTESEGYRLGRDRVALLLPTCGPMEAAERAMAISRAVNGRLLDGRKIDCLVGYATSPRDGATACELLQAAERSTLVVRWARPAVAASPGSPRPVAEVG